MSTPFPDYARPWEDGDLTALRHDARTVFHNEATPHQARWAQQHHVDREFWTKAGVAGQLCNDIPEECGGGGGYFGHEAVVEHELTVADDTAFGSNVHSIAAHSINAFGTQVQKTRWFDSLAPGEKVIGIAMIKPGAGSDRQAVRTYYRRAEMTTSSTGRRHSSFTNEIMRELIGRSL